MRTMEQMEKFQVFAHLLLLLAAVTIQGTEFQYKVDAFLDCNVTNATWEKNGTSVKNLDTSDGEEFVQHSNGTLQIKSPIRENAGVYTCKHPYGNLSSYVSLYAEPKVVPLDTSINLVHGDQLQLTCTVLGYPQPSVKWFKDGTEIQTGGSSRYQLSEADGLANGSLTVDSVEYDNAGNYMCQASSSRYNTTSSQTIIIRVKDKLAPLWPFLGIVAEVVVLSIIIYVFGKKGNRISHTEEDDSSERTSSEKKSKGLRHRGNSNNAKA